MSRGGRYIYKFLDAHPGFYNNRQEILFIVNKDDTVIVYHVIKDLPLEKYFLFGLIYTSNNFNDFIRDFEFASIKQLKALTVERLWELYYKSQADIYCSIMVKVNFIMFFRRAGIKMTASDNYNTIYELDELLQTPREFAEYTRERALLHRSNY